MTPMLPLIPGPPRFLFGDSFEVTVLFLLFPLFAITLVLMITGRITPVISIVVLAMLAAVFVVIRPRLLELAADPAAVQYWALHGCVLGGASAILCRLLIPRHQRQHSIGGKPYSPVKRPSQRIPSGQRN